MPRSKLSFLNQDGLQLSALLESPESPPVAYSIFAHCFTCSKDIAAATRIARALTRKGIAVLRFDFTGIGNSDGDFSNTNFSSNLEDLFSAADFMKENYEAPSLLIGHSLGGAAVLAAGGHMDSVKAIATIGAPATADHLEHMFAGHKDKILNEHEATILLGGREFNIKKHFLEDIARHNSTGHIASLNKPLLILHAPLDKIVSIDEAARIYQAAKHPKSFISLHNADHLLSDPRDSEYAADVIASWANRYLELEEKPKHEDSWGTAPAVQPGQVLITEQDKKFTRRIYTEKHQLVADEPTASGGRDYGPNPYEYLLTALGACTSMTLRMYANHKELELDNIEVTLSHSRVHADDCDECESQQGYVDRIDRQIRLTGDLIPEQRQRLLEIADKCPVHKTLGNEILIKSELVE